MVKSRKRADRPAVAAVAPRKHAGRPAVAAADRRETIVRVLTTEAEQVELQQAAATVGMRVSTWMRAVALERARKIAAEKAKREHHESP